MAVSIATTEVATLGRMHVRVVNVTFDSSYPTGGEAISAADLGLNEILAVLNTVAMSSTPEAFNVRFNQTSPTGGRLLAFRTDAADDVDEEMPNATDLSTFSVRCVFLGK